MAQTDTIFTHDVIHENIKTALDKLDEKETCVRDLESEPLSEADEAFLKMLDELLGLNPSDE